MPTPSSSTLLCEKLEREWSKSKYASNWFFVSLNFFNSQEAMLKAVEVQRESSESSESLKDDIEHLARTHGYPSDLSSLVVDKFDNITMSYMQEHFRTTIPVRA